MAIIDARGSSTIVDLRNTDDWDRLIADGNAPSTTNFGYFDSTVDEYYLEFIGTGLAGGAGVTDALTAGTVTAIRNDLDRSAAGGWDIDITGLSLAAANLNDTVEGMWLAVLAGDDIFYAADDFASYMFGDGHTVSANTVVSGGDDTFTGSSTSDSIFWGDVNTNDGYVIGGNDIMTNVSGSVGGQWAAGDAAINNGTVIGGDDTMSARANVSTTVLVGDVSTPGDDSTLIGGDDILSADHMDGLGGLLQLLGDFAQGGTRTTVIGGNDTLSGNNDGNDIWGEGFSTSGYVEGGDDIIYGYGGNDNLRGDVSGINVAFGLLAGNDIIYGGDGNDLIGGDNEFNNTNEIGMIVEEGRGDDMLYGEAGSDTIRGHVGDDFISGGEDADTLDGGSGFDTADYSDSSAGVTVRLFNGTGLGGDAEGDTLANFEAINGSVYADTLIGASTSDDTLFGDDGDDSLIGLAGNDTLIGGAGADTLDGGASLFDVADYSTSDAAVTVRLFNNVNVGGDAQGDMISNVEGITGSDFNDTLIGSSTQIDTIRGGDGNDALFGLAGNDTLNGGAGADVIDGGASNKDTVDYSDASEGVIIRLFNGTGERGEAEGDTISNVERVVGSEFNDTLIGANALTDFLEGGNGNDSLFGLSGNDFLEGQNGDDILDGGAGADRLFGGNGDDELTGGTESDTFFFEDDLGNDSITDFENGIDFIDVSGITGVNSVADFMSIGQVGNDVVVQIDADNSITIENILVGNIDPTDFIF